MFNFLKKGKEFNRLAKAFNGIYVMVQDVYPQIQQNPSRSEFGETLLAIAFLASKGVDDRIEEGNIAIDAKIMVPTIERGFITVMYAYQQTVGKLNIMAEQLNMSEIVQEVLDKGPAYYKIERTIPPQLIDNI